ncbi:caspase-1-like [Uranotaenia lowii]|uniref:caspase-1-like n=1 Tax=Uranotaenia lowii TaxID=190385 RepID=UPI002479F992|nr:caspase-1-like [Uranotaenia lowii]
MEESEEFLSCASDAQRHRPPTSNDKRLGSVLKVPIDQDSPFYAMNGKKRGKVLIFNHKKFDDNIYKEREGTELDVQNLRASLSKLGFLEEDIVSHDDLSAIEIEWEAKELCYDSTLVSCDCLITVILTHGEKDDRLMARDTSYHLYKFIEKFSPSQLPSMAGKPKLFIVQACRGRTLDSGRAVKRRRSLEDSVDASSEIFTYPEFADFLIVMSSHHGYRSFRKKVQGSWLIQDLCKVLNNCRVQHDSIYDILTKTNLAVSKRISCNEEDELDGKKQVSSFYSTLTRSLYFARK